MILRELFEARQQSVGIIFGRFNPPHQGHRAAWEMASENDAWFVGTNQSTQGPKDPLPYDIKVKAMLAIMPEVKGHIVPETSWLTLASKIYKKYGDVVLNVYTDEDWVTKALVQYNGKEGAHGFYNFSNIEQQATPRLSSATALRAAVQAGDRDAFSKAAGVDADTPVAGQPFFDVVANYLAPHAEKAKVKASKKKVKEPELGEMDSQGYSGSRERKSMSKYGSRDNQELGQGKEGTGKPLTAKQMMDRAHKAMMKSMSDAEKIDKGWRNPNKGVAEGSKDYCDACDGVITTRPHVCPGTEGMAEGPEFDKWADNRAASLLHKLIAPEIKGKIQNIVSDLSDIPGMWDHKAQTFTPDGLDKLKSILKQPKYIKYALTLTADDYEAEDIAEGHGKIEVGDRITWWYNKFHPNYEGIVRKLRGPYIIVYAPGSGQLYQLTKDDIRSHEKKDVGEGIGADMAKLGGIAALGIGAGLAGNYYDQQRPRVDVGGQKAYLIQHPGWGRIPDNAMTLQGKDGKTYTVWASRGKGSTQYYATPAEKVKDKLGDFKEELAELSTELLGRYKKAASADASDADKKGDFKKGDKRFSGIVKATKKQFNNDSKKTDEDAAGVGIITKQNSTPDVNKGTPRKNLKAFRLV